MSCNKSEVKRKRLNKSIVYENIIVSKIPLGSLPVKETVFICEPIRHT